MSSEYAVELRDVVKKFITPEGNELVAVDHVTQRFGKLVAVNGFSMLVEPRMRATGRFGCSST